MDALLAALGSFAAFASLALTLIIRLWQLRRNEIAHLYRRMEQIERRMENSIGQVERRIENIEEDLASLRERVARLEERV